MKKISLFLLCVCAFISPVFANSFFTLEQFLRSYVTVVTDSLDIPDTYSFIRLNYTNISQDHSLYPLFAKVLFRYFPNAKMTLPLSKYITQRQATTIMRQWFPSIVTSDVDTRVSLDWLLSILSSIRYHQSELLSEPSTDPILESDIYKDVLYRIKSLYYYQTWINHTWLLHWAVRGLVDALDDPHTAFFPPTEAHSFTDQLEWQFYGIGAYVEMIEPWFFVITATIDWSPAQNSGLRAGDRIVQVDDHFMNQKHLQLKPLIGSNDSVETKVSLKYLRDWKNFLSWTDKSKDCGTKYRK